MIEFSIALVVGGVQTEVAGPAFLLPTAHPSISVSGRTLGPQDER